QLVDVPLRELAAALEQHVLDPVGGAGHARDLVPRADPVDDPRGQGLRVRDRPEDHLQAVAQGLHVGGHLRRGNAGARYQVARRERRRNSPRGLRIYGGPAETVVLNWKWPGDLLHSAPSFVGEGSPGTLSLCGDGAQIRSLPDPGEWPSCGRPTPA